MARGETMGQSLNGYTQSTHEPATPLHPLGYELLTRINRTFLPSLSADGSSGRVHITATSKADHFNRSFLGILVAGHHNHHYD